MRTYYQVIFNKGNVALTKRFDDLYKANEFCNKVNGILRLRREKIRVAWGF